jgi:hypothetical protein
VRTLEERLTEYRDSLLGLADQLEQVAALAEAQGRDATSIRDGIRLQRIIAGEDLTNLLNGVELKPFMVTGEM